MPASSSTVPALSIPNAKAVEPALEAPLAVHRARWKAAQEELARLDSRSAWLANGRGVAFLAALVLGGLALFQRGPAWGGPAAVALAVAYVVLAIIHQRVFAAEERARTQASLSERGMARCSGAWRELRDTGERFANPDHLCTPDLDVFGHGSLFQLVDQSTTPPWHLGEAASTYQPPSSVHALTVLDGSPHMSICRGYGSETMIIRTQQASTSRMLEVSFRKGATMVRRT